MPAPEAASAASISPSASPTSSGRDRAATTVGECSPRGGLAASSPPRFLGQIGGLLTPRRVRAQDEEDRATTLGVRAAPIAVKPLGAEIGDWFGKVLAPLSPKGRQKAPGAT